MSETSGTGANFPRRKKPKYEFVYPRSLDVGDSVLIDGEVRKIVRMNTNKIRITVYWLERRGVKDVERGFRPLRPNR